MEISKEYIEQLKQLHKEKESFGRSARIPDEVERCIKEYNIQSILDFGCGKGFVTAALKEKYPHIAVYGYDPAQEQFSILPDNVDMIFSQDVLEHVEPEHIDNTIKDLASRCNKVMYHLIACHPAKKSLADGRNAHLIVENPKWWKQKLIEVLDWKLYNENIIDYLTQPKKGPELRIIKYAVTLEKNIDDGQS